MSAWQIDQRGSVAVAAFHRPPANLMDFASMIELGTALEDFASKTEQIKVVLLTSALDEAFIDHAELSDLVKAGQGRATAEELGSWTRALRLLESIPQPTIAAIDGLAAGGGNEIALACTLRCGSERAQLQQPEVTVGIIPGGGGSVRLPRLVGVSVASDAVITGRAFDAHEALQVGWLNALLPTDNFLDHATHWAAGIASSPGPALHAAKKSLVLGSRLPFAEAQALEQELFTELAASSAALIAASTEA